MKLYTTHAHQSISYPSLQARLICVVTFQLDIANIAGYSWIKKINLEVRKLFRYKYLVYISALLTYEIFNLSSMDNGRLGGDIEPQVLGNCFHCFPLCSVHLSADLETWVHK